MGLVIGFGSTEEQFEAAEEATIREHIVERAKEREASHFSDQFIGEIRKWIGERSDELRALDRSYKTTEIYPDRYGYYSSTVIADASHIVVILRFLHTNRRHGLSPDGWACLQTKRVFYVDKWDDIDSRRAFAA
jgi:hypothetical protein